MPSYPNMRDMSKTITIAQGQSVSAALDLGTLTAVGFIVPAVVEATTARISFLASDTLAGTYRTVTVGGSKYALTIAVNDFALLANPGDLLGVRFLKIVAETAAGVAVAQATQADVFGVIGQQI